jgi:hypothetical protein
MVSDKENYTVNGKTLKKLLKALIFSHNSTKRSMTHLQAIRDEAKDNTRLGSLANGINNKMRTLKGNETIFRTYLGDEDLEKLGIKKEPEDAKA